MTLHYGPELELPNLKFDVLNEDINILFRDNRLHVNSIGLLNALNMFHLGTFVELPFFKFRDDLESQFTQLSIFIMKLELYEIRDCNNTMGDLIARSNRHLRFLDIRCDDERGSKFVLSSGILGKIQLCWNLQSLCLENVSFEFKSQGLSFWEGFLNHISNLPLRVLDVSFDEEDAISSLNSGLQFDLFSSLSGALLRPKFFGLECTVSMRLTNRDVFNLMCQVSLRNAVRFGLQVRVPPASVTEGSESFDKDCLTQYIWICKFVGTKEGRNFIILWHKIVEKFKGISDLNFLFVEVLCGPQMASVLRFHL